MKDLIRNLRIDYAGTALDERHVHPQPLIQFETWLKEAIDKQVPEPHAMILATASRAGQPSMRTVLLRDYDEKGFVFFTNYNSRKGKEIDENPFGSVLFYWPLLQRQIQIEGRLEKSDPGVSEAYFKSRPVPSQIASWISPQSVEIDGRDFLDRNFLAFEKKYTKKEIPYPDFWGGYCLRPLRYEFWQGQADRLHDRIQFSCDTNDNSWKISRLAP
ncbi:MAG: pyridoxamine 5'-phosphate oxidase [Bacteroidia bacterium]